MKLRDFIDFFLKNIANLIRNLAVFITCKLKFFLKNQVFFMKKHAFTYEFYNFNKKNKIDKSLILHYVMKAARAFLHKIYINENTYTLSYNTFYFTNKNY
jgi:hypothetical protein